MKITLAGDICSNFNGDINIDDSIFLNSDLVIANLEFPVTESGKEAFKSEVNFKGNPDTAQKVIEAIGCKNIFMNLANNHIMDYGQEGLDDTVALLERNDVLYCGISKDSDQSPELKVMQIEGVKIGVICICEKQFGISQIDKIGSSYCDARIYGKIIAAKKLCDVLVVSVHASQEMNQWPAPEWQKQLRSYIEVGADIIHGHHSHVVQGYEKFQNGLIFYGLGNFIANEKSWQCYDNTLWSLAVDIEVDHDKSINFKPFSCKIESRDEVTYIKKVKDGKIEEYLGDCNAALKDYRFLTSLWHEYSMKIFDKYYKKYLFTNEIPVDKNFLKKVEFCLKLLLGRIGKRPEKREKIAFLYHLFCCESHKLAIETALGISCKELTDLRNKESQKMINKYFQL